MRKNREIDQAIAILRKKGDKTSMIQAEVLKERHTEVWVFEHYVRNVSEGNRDEAAYCAAREAALFLTGKLELETLIPDVSKYGAVRLPDTPKKISSEALLRRIEKLEILVEELLDERRRRCAYKKMPESYSRADFLIQQKAYEYIGCSRGTLKSWTDKGLVTGYRKGTKVYYSKSELDASPTVRNFMNINHKIG